MEQEKRLQQSMITIASEFFRFQRIFEKVLSKLDIEEQGKYRGQFSWFSKKVDRALENADLKIQNVEGQLYDPGMAITPLNIDDFDPDDPLFVEQMIEPIVMQGDTVCKIGTAILGRVEKPNRTMLLLPPSMWINGAIGITEAKLIIRLHIIRAIPLFCSSGLWEPIRKFPWKHPILR